MTAITRPVRRETNVRVQGRALCLELNKLEIVLRQKGRRQRVAVPIEAIWHLAWKLKKREADRLKPKRRKQ